MSRRVVSAVAAAVGCAAVLAAGLGTTLAAQRAPVPAIPNLAGKVLTVAGVVDPATLGDTSMHEHILIDYKPLADQTPTFATTEAAALYERPLTLQTLYAAHYGQGLRWRKPITDVEVARREVMEFKKVGGRTIADMTNIGLGRDPRALLNIAQSTGLNIVMGAGWYARDYHPRNMDQLTLDEMTDTIVRDVVAGAEGTDIRSGIIGEIGIEGDPLTDNELKSIRASARAARITGAPMSFHRGGTGDEKFRVLDIVASEGVELTRVVMGHANPVIADLPTAKRLMDRGVFLEADYIGLAPPPGNMMNHRDERSLLVAIKKVIDAGYGDRILLGHDICAKQQLKTYGGTGYSYIHEYFLPELKRIGVTDEAIRKIMIDNPRRALTFVAPKPLVATSTAAR